MKISVKKLAASTLAVALLLSAAACQSKGSLDITEPALAAAGAQPTAAAETAELPTETGLPAETTEGVKVTEAQTDALPPSAGEAEDAKPAENTIATESTAKPTGSGKPAEDTKPTGGSASKPAESTQPTSAWIQVETIGDPGGFPTQVHEHFYCSDVTKWPTCTTTGVCTYTCSCGDSYTESIPKADHTWNHTHTDATGHWVGSITCQCGWVLYEYQSNHGGNLAEDFMDHCFSYSTEERLREHDYYNDSSDYYVIDTPAIDTWTCSVCGATTNTQP